MKGHVLVVNLVPVWGLLYICPQKHKTKLCKAQANPQITAYNKNEA